LSRGPSAPQGPCPGGAADRADSTRHVGLPEQAGRCGASNGQPGCGSAALPARPELLEPADSQTTNRTLWLQDLRFTYGRLGDASLAFFDFPAAQNYYRKSLEYAEALAADPKSDTAPVELSVTYDRLGGVSLRLCDYAAGEAYYRKSLEIRKSPAAHDP